MIQGETRDAVLLTIPASTPAKPDEAALKAFYEENKTLSYLRPEQRVLDYVVLTKADIEGLTTNKAGEKTSREEALHQFGNDVEDALAAGKTMGEAFKAAGIVATVHTLNNATAETSKTRVRPASSATYSSDGITACFTPAACSRASASSWTASPSRTRPPVLTV